MKKLLLSMVALVTVFSLSAQVDDLPANPEEGKCYVKCVTPDVYETKTVEVMVKPAYKKLNVVPAEYKTVEERILVKPASKKFIYHPAVFETYYEDMQTEQPFNKLSVAPASFSDATKEIEVAPAMARWEYKTYEDCNSNEPGDCRMLCWVEYDRIAETVPTKTLSKPAGTTATPAGGKTIKVKKQRITKEAYVEEVEIPAEYKTITKRVLVADEKTTEVAVPAEYKTISVESLKEKGGISKWVEVDCGLTSSNILPIYYELNSARLTPASKKIIDEKLLKLMNDKPLIRIELASHTDSRGSAASNQDLSQRRAQSVVNYLVAKGIAKNRLVAKGYGETRLVNKCADGVQCSESEHQKNRRTEFRVLSY